MMSTYETAGHAMLQAHTSRGLAFAIARALGAAFAAPAVLPADRLSGASFLDQEPSLAKEAHEYIRSF